MSASRISPVRGSTRDGPMASAPSLVSRYQRTEAWRRSAVSKSAFSGCISTRIASLKPMRSKALFHSRMPAFTVSRYFSGMLRSSQNTMGCFGSDSAALGSFFSRRQRFTKYWRGKGAMSLVYSCWRVTKCPTRGSALRVAIGSSGSFARL